MQAERAGMAARARQLDSENSAHPLRPRAGRRQYGLSVPNPMAYCSTVLCC